ncbi:MAG: hypothetical protein ABH882_07745 [Candidatus Omnitrophota bacterium]|nr:hypothetical protein [Candidatus Omnitrophota bacterium]MBU1928655.1 hypothetical protein [Candidatus Omnitrophota bacterium]MBU2035780.1 hypothetical protein [Candidatus Omnitrophota bacterium]MBU2258330.1 hypothetical protein [Candidatus Omnitrophota bacterium]
MTRPKGILTMILLVAILAAGLNYSWQLKTRIGKLRSNINILNKEKQVLTGDLKKEKELYNDLNGEYQKVQDKLKLAGDRLIQIDAEFQSAQKTIEELNFRISILNVEGETLRKENDEAKFNLDEVTQEKNALQDRMNSIAELKKAIKELKKQRKQVMREVARWIAPKPDISKPAAKEIKPEVEGIGAEEVFEGNRGFLIKDKKPTYRAKVKIEVEPFNR